MIWRTTRETHRKAKDAETLTDTCSLVKKKKGGGRGEGDGTLVHLWLFSIMETAAYSWRWCIFLYVSVNVIKAITPSCLVLTFCPLSMVELWLLLSSSVSKLNNQEEKNITCGKFTPFSFASYYPNSSLILYHYYPPTNDRVEAIAPLNTSLPKNKTQQKTQL